MSFFNELKRRNVFRVAIAYLALAWLLIEVTDTLFPAFGIPAWAFRFVVILFALGFAPTLFFSWAYEITPEGVKREKDVVRDASITRFTAKRLDGITISLVIVAVVFILTDRFWLSSRLAEQPTASVEVVADHEQTSETELQYPANSIAVLPFVNMSDDAANEYFSDGISEELINLLAKIPELSVISRTSAFSYKGKDINLAKIAKELNVAHILEGSVRKAGNQVRITTQLIDTHSDTHVWSETYDRELIDIFAIQDEIAAKVVAQLKVTLLGSVPTVEEINPTAYALYLQATYLRRQSSEGSAKQAIELYKQALAIAPDYASAWRGLAVTYLNNRYEEDEYLTLAHEAVNKALDIDPYYAEAHSLLGVFSWENGDLAAAARQYQYALSLEPTNLTVIGNASNFLDPLGRLDEGVAAMEYLLKRDPLNPVRHYNLAGTYYNAGRPDDAIAASRTLLMLAPHSSYAYAILSGALLDKGDSAAALKAIQKEPSEASRRFGLVRVYHALGQVDESDAGLTELIAEYGKKHPFSIAHVLAYRGEADRAFIWLDKAVQHKDPGLDSIPISRGFANIHDDPRWLPFLESIGRSPAQLDAIEFKITLPE